jgi:hypothetical protein
VYVEVDSNSIVLWGFGFDVDFTVLPNQVTPRDARTKKD